MGILRNLGAYVAATGVIYCASTLFYTQQALANQALSLSAGQFLSTYGYNLAGLATQFGLMLAIAVAIAFGVASLVKRIVKPLAGVAYPIAGAVAAPLLFYLIENVAIGGGVGVFYGARGGLGMVLQAVAGGLGGIVFEWLRTK